MTFDPNDYSPMVADLLADERVAELGPGTPNRAARPKLETLTAESMVGPHPIADHDMAACCESALWLYHDFVDESHRRSQEIHTSTGSYWHGIMHRREPDFSNSKYWFDRVGSHPVFEPLGKAAAEMVVNADLDRTASFLESASTWDPYSFIDLCRSVLGSGSQTEHLCRRIQLREWQILFDYCYRLAKGGEEK